MKGAAATLMYRYYAEIYVLRLRDSRVWQTGVFAYYRLAESCSEIRIT